MRRIACTFSAALACHPTGPQASSSSFGTLPVSTGPTDTSTDGDTSTSSGGSSTSPVPEDSTAGASTDTTGGTTMTLDVGMPDAGAPGPEGCRGKIDFLFVIESHGNMEAIQDKLVAALPEFIATIQSRFADFDYQVMVVDTHENWGNYWCNESCTPEGCAVPGYPCELLDTLTTCDWTLGAGTIFNAGEDTFNKPCSIAGGRRYLVKGQPDLTGTFECIARVGTHGGSKIGEALADAVTPAKTAHCNEGFIRDDALLFVSLIHYTTDWQSDGTPEQWAQAVLDAKHGDADAVVVLDIGPISGTPWSDLETCAKNKDNGHLCRMLKFFPHRLWKDQAVADYAAAFDEAAEFVDDACSSFIPR